MSADDLTKRTYDMVLVMYQDWPVLKGKVIAHDAQLAEHGRRLAENERKADDTDRHEIERLQKQLERRDEQRETRRHSWVMWAAGIVGALLVSACTGAVGAIVASHQMGPPAGQEAGKQP